MLLNTSIGQAVQSYQNRQYTQALESLQQADKADPHNPLVQLWLGKTYHALNLRQEAIAAFQQVMEVSTEPELRDQAHELLEIIRLDSARMEDSTAVLNSTRPISTAKAGKTMQERSGGLGWSRLSLRVKTVIAAILMGAAPTIAIGIGIYVLAKGAFEQQVVQANEQTTNAAATRLASYMRERFGDIQIMASLDVFTDATLRDAVSVEAKQAALDKFIKAYIIYDSIAVFDLKGNVISQSTGEPLGNHANREYFQQALQQNKPILTQPIFSKSSGEYSVYMAAPVVDKGTNQTIGVVRARLPVSFIEQTIRNLGQDGNAYLIDANGKVFATANGTLLTGANAETTAPLAKTAIPTYDTLEDAQKTASARDAKNLYSVVPFSEFKTTTDPFLKDLPELGWNTVVEKDAKTAFASVNQILFLLQIGVAAAVLTVSAIAVLVANRAIKPVLASSEAVKQLGQGELDTRLAVEGEDELAVLAENINAMADQIQQLLKNAEDQAETRKVEKETLTRQVNEVAQAVTQISTGDLGTRIPRLEADGGLVQGLAENINQMAEQIQHLIDTQASLTEDQAKLAAEREQQAQGLTQQVRQLLSEVKVASKGDLTAKAKVGDGEMGAVADSFNYLVLSLRRIVNNIQETTSSVINSTGVSMQQTADLATQAQTQATQIDRTLIRLNQVVNSIEEVAQAATQAEAVVQKATQTAQLGGDAVDRTVEGINQLRQTIGDAAKMMKRLGEGSQQISQIVTLISQIAAKTDLLALNATIEAARAGEQGQGFAVVADEVRKLAERSAAATKEISEIVDSIQMETTRMIGAMDAGTEEVVRGTRLAAEAKQNLQEIIQVSQNMNELVRDISLATQLQAQTAAEISSDIEKTRSETNQTATKATTVTATLEELTTVVADLKSSVGSFRTA
jgi:twitching motility protein PilJ